MKKTLLVLVCVMLCFAVFAKGNGDQAKNEVTTLTLLVDRDASIAGIEAVAALAEQEIGIKIEIELRPGDPEGTNIVKTRLSANEMTDLCFFNSGSLFKALGPDRYFIDISNEPWVKNLDGAFIDAVSVDGKILGIPASSTQAGAIMYNKKVYAKYGLTPPKTWKEFIQNCDVLKAAGETALIGTFKDSWTSQVLFLGDNYNVCAANPTFPQEFEAGKAKNATTPAALRSFQKLSETQPYYNADYTAATFMDGVDMMATGKGAHWIMLTQVLSAIEELYGDAVNDIGVFAVPGDDPNDNGLTVWNSAGIYGNINSDKKDAILKFMEFYVSEKGITAYANALKPIGPFHVKGISLPSNVYPAVSQDMQAYFDSGKTEAALEFQTAVKGANAPSICSECASGQTTALEAAEAYDQDCYKQAVQLGLNWD